MLTAVPYVEAKADRVAGIRVGGIHALRGIRHGRAARFMPPGAEPAANVRATTFGRPRRSGR